MDVSGAISAMLSQAENAECVIRLKQKSQGPARPKRGLAVKAHPLAAKAALI